MEFLALNGQTSPQQEAYIRNNTVLSDIMLEYIYPQFTKERIEGKSCNYKKVLQSLAVKMLNDMIWNDVFATSEVVTIDTVNIKYNACNKIGCYIEHVSHPNKKDLYLIGNAHLCKSEDITYSTPTPPTGFYDLYYKTNNGVLDNIASNYTYSSSSPSNGDSFTILVPNGSLGVCIAIDSNMNGISDIYSPMSGSILSLFSVTTSVLTLPNSTLQSYTFYTFEFPNALTGDINYTITL